MKYNDKCHVKSKRVISEVFCVAGLIETLNSSSSGDQRDVTFQVSETLPKNCWGFQTPHVSCKTQVKL